MYDVGVIIVSDRAASGERADTCVPVFEKSFTNTQYKIVESVIVSDEPDCIKEAIWQMIEKKHALVFTSGGTGCAPRDNTPEATLPFIEKKTPGIDEAIRAFSLKKTVHAIYSRGISGIAGETLIINLPGSPKAVAEILEFLLSSLVHSLRLIGGEKIDCAETKDRHD